MARTTITFTHETSGGWEHTHTLPAKLAVCPRCEGHGTHLHPDIGGHAYSVEEFRESFDEEEAAEYFRRGGRYDVTCLTCHGRNVVPVVDEEACQATTRGRRLLALYQRVTAEREQLEAEARYEQRMEAKMLGEWDGD